ncbi:cytochrome b [Vogesella sp. LIG4]|uniref:cytochrome b n=1 Tax=Vogesella sp. LIG4 TaxID=1192162 RepID=UPI00081FC074|nr:cytochrome b [Vogesella sp. LIG4]SCK21689.1 cytochrome b561 [Vogesella sp. LIG4]
MHTNTPRYSPAQILMHWLMAVLIIAAFAFGRYVDSLPLSPTKFRLISYHKWLGISILALLVLRVLLRLAKRAPALPASMGPVARLAAHGGHAALYLLMLVIPVSGWLMSSAYGIPVVLFGVLPLPDLLAANPELAEQLKAVHGLLNNALLLVVIGHVLAALKHQFIDKDGLLERMRPGR